MTVVTRYREYVIKTMPCGRKGVYLHGRPVHLAEDESSARAWIDVEITARTNCYEIDTRN
jgi:hypothetical protein